MSRSPAPPLYESFAVPETRQDKPFPKLVIGEKWAQYVSGVVTQVNQSPARKAHVSLSGQVAAIPTTGLPIASVAPGVYRVSYRTRITTPGTISSSLTITISWTEGGIALSQAGAAIIGNTTSSFQFGTFVVRADANTPISYAAAYVSDVAGSMAFNLDITAEAVALDT